MEATAGTCIVADWHDALRARFPDLVARKQRTLPFSITSFRGLPADLHQPALADDVLCLHRGGEKRVHRVRDGFRTVHEVPLHSLTLIPKHRSALWRTEGPDNYLHISLSPKALDDFLMTELGRSRSQIGLRDDVGFTSPVLSGLAQEMERVADEPTEAQLYVDTLFTAFVFALLRHGTRAAEAPTIHNENSSRSGGLAGWRLRQIVEYMEANQARQIELGELTQVSGLSRAHFFRAFRQSTGMTPGRYLERLRVENARGAIDGGKSIEEAALQAGFLGTAALSQAFRRVMNITPAQYRRWYR